MARKRLTRKKVNDPIVDTALRDIYDKIEHLMPETAGKTSKTAPQIGDFQLVNNGDQTSLAQYTEEGWMVDMNSNYATTSNSKDFRPSVGSTGKSRTPVKGEAVRYDRNKNIAITNDKQERVLLNNTNNELHIRNADNTADVSIKAKQLKISGGTAAEAGDITRTPKTDSTVDIVTIATNNLFIPGSLTNEAVQTALTIISEGNQDAIISLGDAATPNWVFGYDHSDSGKFKIHGAANSTLPDAADFELDTSGNLVTAGTITDGSGNASNMFYDVQRIGYYATTTANYIPMTGYVVERTSATDFNEFLGFIAPYNGSVHQVQWRSEVAQNGTTTLKIYESADGTEVPGSLTGQKDESINIADDTTHTYNLSSMTSGNTNLVKGRIYALYISHPSAPQDTNATVVFKWDATT